MSAQQLSAVLANLTAQTALIEKGATEALTEIGRGVAEAASGRAPVVTGHLRDSWLGGPDGINSDGLVVGTDKHGPFVEVGTNLPYASEIEYEDVAMIRPALHEAEADFHAKIRAHVHTTSGVTLT